MSDWTLGELLAKHQAGKDISTFFSEFADCYDDELFMGELISTYATAAAVIRDAVFDLLIATADGDGEVNVAGWLRSQKGGR